MRALGLWRLRPGRRHLRRDKRTRDVLQAADMVVCALGVELAVTLLVSWVRATVLTVTLILVLLVLRRFLTLRRRQGGGGRPAPTPADRTDPATLERLASKVASGVPAVVLARARSARGPAPVGDEHRRLRAALRGAADETVQGRPALAVDPGLCDVWFRGVVTLCGWYASEHHLGEWGELAAEAKEAGERADHAAMVRWATIQLGVVARLRGEAERACVLLESALPARGHWADPQVLTNLGLALRDQGKHGQAIRHLRRARRYRTRRDWAGRGLTEMALGVAYAERGESGNAESCFRRAERHFAKLPGKVAEELVEDACRNRDRAVGGAGVG